MNVWYVSYGSNLSYERFLCYIKGEKPVGSDKKERGCRNQNLPLSIETLKISHPIYFSKEKSKWGKGGVAFIGHQQCLNSCTLGRMYLITKEQFSDVVAQENDLEQIIIDFDEVIRNGKAIINDGWYGRIIYLGLKDDFPMFTFTSNFPYEKASYNPPSANYLRTIAIGLQEMGLKEEEIVSYFLDKSGINMFFSKDQLFQYIFPR